MSKVLRRYKEVGTCHLRLSKKRMESMVGAIEKVMNEVSNGLAKERKERECEERNREDRPKKKLRRG